MTRHMRRILCIIGAVALGSMSHALGETESPGQPMFLLAPMAGTINSDVQYTSPGNAAMRTISDNGPLYALNMLYASSRFAVGSMGHSSTLDKSKENGYLFYGLYYFNETRCDVRPMIGFYADYIHVFTHATAADVAPLVSMDVNTSIWGLHPIAGLSFMIGKQRITPFIGYFNEQVDTSLSSEGISFGGQRRNGFSAKSSAVLDYMSAGIKAELVVAHFIRFDTKFYSRFKNGDEAQFTARNRLDFLLSRSFGISVKYDYFGDKYEKNTFTMVGPVFVF